MLGILCTMPRYDVSASWLYSKMADYKVVVVTIQCVSRLVSVIEQYTIKRVILCYSQCQDG